MELVLLFQKRQTLVLEVTVVCEYVEDEDIGDVIRIVLDVLRSVKLFLQTFPLELAEMSVDLFELLISSIELSLYLPVL